MPASAQTGGDRLHHLPPPRQRRGEAPGQFVEAAFLDCLDTPTRMPAPLPSNLHAFGRAGVFSSKPVTASLTARPNAVARLARQGRKMRSQLFSNIRSASTAGHPTAIPPRIDAMIARLPVEVSP